jgi:predicted PP-loop superfamily ATPase
MSDQTPTAEDVRNAEETIARFKAAEFAASIARKQQAQVAFDGGYDGLADRLNALPAEVRNDPALLHHVDAILRGLSGLVTPIAS